MKLTIAENFDGRVDILVETVHQRDRPNELKSRIDYDKLIFAAPNKTNEH